jgi:hypothetical protein
LEFGVWKRRRRRRMKNPGIGGHFPAFRSSVFIYLSL